MMKQLLNTPVDDRDEAWEAQFFAELPSVHFEFLSDSPIEGPDGFPYLAVKIVDQGEPSDKVLDWLGEKGVGLAVNPDQEAPDYVFSYGMIWNYLLNGEFLTPSDDDFSGGRDLEFEPGEEMMAGTPSESYWPHHVRALFKEFLQQQGIHKPRVVMLSQNGKTYDLCFSLESLGDPPQEEWQGILEGFSWFFPMHYSFSIISESAIEGIDFLDV
jgi:hypothetical protein